MWSEYEDSAEPDEPTIAGEEVSEDDDTHVDIIPVERRGLAREFADFIVYNAAWWMVPILLVLAAMVAFILFAESSPVLPFIYTVI